ncbi:MAG: hypothetical protein P9L91_07670 [Candidatus Zophobacter franzmannii]|jgi:hypothetical protein|nr:hypothetical protein [Candidatus Zophobacter franzmannii]
MADKSVWFETVKHYINVLVTMIVIFGTATGLYIGWYQSRAGKMIWVSNSYHLASSYHCASVSEHYLKLSQHLSEYLCDAVLKDAEMEDKDMVKAMEAYEKLSEEVGMVVLLQTIHKDENFQVEADLIKDQFNSIVISSEMNNEELTNIMSSIATYLIPLDELEIKHFEEHLNMELKVKTWRKRRVIYFAIFITLIVLISFGLVRRITSLIKMILFRLLEENDERESERKMLQAKDKQLDDLRTIIQRIKQDHPDIKI